MFNKFCEMFQDTTIVTVNHSGDPMEGPYGRYEFVKTCDDMEIHHYFCDMNTYPPDSEITTVMQDFDPYIDMCKAIMENNIGKAMEAAQGIQDYLEPPIIKAKKTLTQRMADVEYPMLHYMFRNKYIFVLLNPNKGTIKRAQEVYKSVPLSIILTGREDNDRYVEYRQEVNSMNEQGWKVQEIPYAQLDRRQLYYGGFTAKKHIDELRIVGYEINPRNVVMSYDGIYQLNPNSQGTGELIEIERSVGYVYSEEYKHEPTYYRYCADYIKEQLRKELGYREHTYPLMYNVISSEGIYGMNTDKILKTELRTIVGYINGDMGLESPYDACVASPHVKEFVVSQNEMMVVATDQQHKVAGCHVIKYKNPIKKYDMYRYHYEALCQYVIKEPRRKVQADIGIYKVVGDYEVGEPRHPCIGVTYSEAGKIGYVGEEAAQVWQVYDVFITRQLLEKYLRDKYIFLREAVVFSDCVVVSRNKKNLRKRAKIKNKTQELVRPYRKGERPYYYYQDKWYNEKGDNIEPLLYDGTMWRKGKELPHVYHYSMVKMKDGPYEFGGDNYVPMVYAKYSLMRWYQYIRRYPYVKYYSNNEYIVMHDSLDFGD